MGRLGKSRPSRQADDATHGVAWDLAHLEHPFRPAHIPMIITQTLLGVIVLSLHYTVYGDGFSDRALTTYCILYAAVTFVWLLAKALRRPPHNWLSPDVVFWLVYTMFHLPYIVFYLVGMADYSRTVFHATEATNRAMTCVVVCAVGFLIGYELGPIGRRQPAPLAAAPAIPAGVFTGGQLLFALTGLVAAFALLAGVGPVIAAYGYQGFRRIGRLLSPEVERWVSISLTGLRVGIAIYLAACILRYRKIVHGVLLPGFLAVILLFFVLLGARSEAAVAALPAVLGYHYFIKPIRLWWGIPVFLIALIMFGAIGIGRRAESLHPSDIYQAYEEYRRETGVNPFVASLAETGASFKTVNVACAYIPNAEPYWHGRSLLHSVFMIIPSPVAGLRTYISPSNWATTMATGDVRQERAGWGSSIAMEAYMNFGLLGAPVFMLAVGYTMRRIYDTTLRRPGFLRVCFILVTVTSLALWCRNYSHHFLRPTVWTMATAWLVWSVFGGGRREPAHYRPPGRGWSQ